jgi:hypothetical protein
MNPLIAKQLFSEAGNLTLTDASGEVTGEFAAIQILDETTFETLVDAIEVDAEDFGGDTTTPAVDLTYAPGTLLVGRFTKIEVTSGACRVALAARNSL